MSVDIVKVKSDIRKGELRVSFHNGNILLVHAKSGESVKIGELPKCCNPYHDDEDGDV